MENAMSFTMADIIKALTVVFTGLMAGLFFSYSYSVNKGLGSLPDAGYLQAFQQINSAIQNPVFFMCFMGLLLLFPAACWQSYQQDAPWRFYCWLLAALLYFMLVMGVTAMGNVPLNNQLEAANLTNATAEELAQLRARFEGPWNFYHSIRTLACIISFSITVIAVFKKH